MRFSTLFAAAAMTMVAAGTTPAQAPFEGIISFGSAMTGHFRNGKLYLKGANARLEAPAQPGALIMTADGRAITVMESKHIYMVFGKRSGKVGSAPKFESLGKSDVIAGVPCDYYRAHEPGHPHDGEEACITGALGFVGFIQGGPAGDMDATIVREQFPKGFFILQSSNQKGVITTEVAKIERTALNDDLFAPPAGYTEMKLPGMALPPIR